MSASSIDCTVILGFLLALAGCASTQVYRGADPVDPGAWQAGGALGVGVLADREQETRIPSGHVQLDARRGMTENLDLGLRLYTLGLQGNATWRVVRGGWSWALAPAVEGARTRESALTVDAIHGFAHTTVIATRALSPSWALSLGPSVGFGLYWPETGGSAHGVWLGGFVNASGSFWQDWHFVPELGLFRVFSGEVPVKGVGAELGAALLHDF
jgi:hypothetical protein